MLAFTEHFRSSVSDPKTKKTPKIKHPPKKTHPHPPPPEKNNYKIVFVRSQKTLILWDYRPMHVNVFEFFCLIHPNLITGST